MNLFWFILAFALMVIGLALIITSPTFGPDQPGAIAAGIIVLLIGLGTLFMDSFHVVPTRTVAMETSFGKPRATMNSGWHWMAPWANVEEFSAAVETLKLSGDKDDDGDPIVVRLANGATAEVDLTVQWQIDPAADITPLYNDYRTFEKIGTNVVRRQLASAANEAMERYDPLVALRDNKGDASGKKLTDLAADVRASLEKNLPPGILVRSVLMPKIKFSDDVQAKLNQYLSALAETQIAEQRQKTAEAQKKANDLLASGIGTNQAVLYQNCLDMVERLSRDGKPLPAAFTCGTPPTVTVPVGAK